MPFAPPAIRPEIQRNELAHLQLEIARRADELARSAACGRRSDLDLWLQAEHEVFARRAPPPNVTARSPRRETIAVAE